MLMKDWKYWVSGLGLAQHPEGGYYRELYKCSEIIEKDDLQGDYDGDRNLASSIYFLLPSNEVSHFHRLKSDELWYFHAGSSLTVYVIDLNGKLLEMKLGLDLEKGEQPQVIIPRGCIFGAVVNEEDSFSLVGCVVSPGFDFRDFELLSRAQLLKEYPQHEEIINRLT
ncbi:MAG: cupin domain-containing protein [Clostridia bacterium]|nr:cupin domain-containing protein [Clostridia bacterium]